MGEGVRAALDVRILGPLEVAYAGQLLALKPAKGRALLALLTLDPARPLSVDRLTDELWAGEPPKSAPASVRVLVSRLREAFAAVGAQGALVTRAPGYALDVSPDQVDARRFEVLLQRGRGELAADDPERAAATLRDALALWRGPALSDVSDAPAAAAEAARLDELRLLAVEDRLSADLACGRHNAVLGEVESLVRAHPFRERLWATRMLVLYRCGRQADALAAYTELRGRLVDELGIEPSHEVRELQAAILAQDPVLTVAQRPQPPRAMSLPGGGADELPPAEARAAAAAVAFDLPKELQAPADAVFVGRAAELERLSALWRDAMAGGSRVAMLAGEPGIGKTRLAGEVVRQAHDDGAIVLFGRCDEDLGVPYQPFAQALRAYAAAIPTGLLAAQAGRAAGDLARLVPELGEQLLGAQAATSGDPEHARDRLFAAVASLLAAVSRARPVVLVLDDLHWADKPSLLMLRHLLRSREEIRALVLGTYRDTELDRAHPLAEVLADLRSDLQIERIRLKGLEADAVGAYFESAAGQPLGTKDAALARALHESTEGNPFFLGEVLRHLVESGVVREEDGHWVAIGEVASVGLPEGVRDVIGRRLMRLSEAANRALVVASVIGSSFGLSVLERVPDSGGDPDRLLDALEEALRAGLIAEAEASRYAFSHVLIRQTLYAELTATRRARLHRRVGEAIEQSQDPDAHVEALAHHFAEAALDGQIGKAGNYLLAAGRRALERLAHEQAVAQLERGVELLELEPSAGGAQRAELLLALAQARRELGDLEGNRGASLRAAEIARAIGSPTRLARAALVYWSAAGFGVTDPTVLDLCGEALAALGDAEPALRARLLARVAHYRAMAESEGFALAGEAEQALALARSTGDAEALTTALRVAIRLLYGSERVDERLSAANELAELGVRQRDERSVLTAIAFRADAHVELADRAGYDRDRDEMRRRSAGRDTRVARYLVATLESMCALLEGRLDDAVELSEQAVLHGGGRADPLSAHQARMTQVRREQGRVEDAVRHARNYAECVRGHPQGVALHAMLLAEAGDRLAAQEALARLVADDLAVVPRDSVWPAALSHLAEVCVQLRDGARAELLYEHLRPHGGHLILLGGHTCFGAVDHFLGTLAAALGRDDDARVHFDAALETAERMRAPLFAARTRAARGS